jgi:hypothetical protein
MSSIEEQPTTLLSWSMWGVAYAVVSGVKIVSMVPGNNGRLGWRLDDTDGKAAAALDTWRNGSPMVDGRLLVQVHFELMDDVREFA